MEPQLFCQSCTMPIDDISVRGTEKDGTKSTEYCYHCYSNGEFTEPSMTYQQMRDEVVMQMKKFNLPDAIIQKSLDSLSHLKRWRKSEGKESR